jgi:membrane protein implicated in regulation of membrane protease activity
MELWFWGILFVLAVVVEIASQQLVSIWAAAGALVALIAALFGAPVWLQAVLFLVATSLLLLLTRPLVRKFTNFTTHDTNLRLDLGKHGLVVQTIDPKKGTGRVRVDDIDWIALSEPNLVIPEGEMVTVQAINGTKLFVVPMQTQTEPEEQPAQTAQTTQS